MQNGSCFTPRQREQHTFWRARHRFWWWRWNVTQPVQIHCNVTDVCKKLKIYTRASPRPACEYILITVQHKTPPVTNHWLYTISVKPNLVALFMTRTIRLTHQNPPELAFKCSFKFGKRHSTHWQQNVFNTIVFLFIQNKLLTIGANEYKKTDSTPNSRPYAQRRAQHPLPRWQALLPV